jgi:hypothetical protein
MSDFITGTGTVTKDPQSPALGMVKYFITVGNSFRRKGLKTVAATLEDEQDILNLQRGEKYTLLPEDGPAFEFEVLEVSQGQEGEYEINILSTEEIAGWFTQSR